MPVTLEAIEKAVADLPPEEMVKFRAWFSEYDGERWDGQIESDAAAGKLDCLAKEALEEYRSGKATPI